MTENLNEMLKEFNKTSEADEEIETNEEANSSEKEETNIEVKTIPLIAFSSWVEKYQSEITNCGLKVLDLEGIKQIDPKEKLIFKVPTGKKDKEEKDIMTLQTVGDAKVLPVLDLEPVKFTVHRNDAFSIVHNYNDKIAIKCYGLKTGPLLFHCLKNGDSFIPFSKEKIKRKNSGKITVREPNIQNILSKLPSNTDHEGIFLLYKQAQKIYSELTTNQSTLDWFNKRQNEVLDINHLIKIDLVLLHIFC